MALPYPLNQSVYILQSLSIRIDTQNILQILGEYKAHLWQVFSVYTPRHMARWSQGVESEAKVMPLAGGGGNQAALVVLNSR
jgi:hypothetical protein